MSEREMEGSQKRSTHSKRCLRVSTVASARDRVEEVWDAKADSSRVEERGEVEVATWEERGKALLGRGAAEGGAGRVGGRAMLSLWMWATAAWYRCGAGMGGREQEEAEGTSQSFLPCPLATP